MYSMENTTTDGSSNGASTGNDDDLLSRTATTVSRLGNNNGRGPGSSGEVAGMDSGTQSVDGTYLSKC